MLVDGYIRLSPHGSRGVPGPERRQLIEWTTSRGWRVGGVVSEVWDAWPNGPPQLCQAVARIWARERDGLVVVTLAHLGDSLEQALRPIEQIAAAGGTFASVRDGIDLSTPSGRRMLRLLISVSTWWPSDARPSTNLRGSTIYRTPGRTYGGDASDFAANREEQER